MKVLTVCAGGTVRSVSMALALKRGGHDALALSQKWNSPEVFEMLAAWADRVIVMGDYGQRISQSHASKIMRCEVGPDVWGNAQNKDLYSRCEGWLRDNFSEEKPMTKAEKQVAYGAKKKAMEERLKMLHEKLAKELPAKIKATLERIAFCEMKMAEGDDEAKPAGKPQLPPAQAAALPKVT